MSVIFLFIDGVGLGDAADSNPFTRAEYPAFSRMAGGQSFDRNTASVYKGEHLFKPVDANLGIEGLPQSGTGQTTLFTGVNAAAVIGKHFGPFPHSGIKHLLREQSLFLKAQRMGRSCHFVNAYPQVFFNKSKKRNRWSCTTLMTKSAGLKLNTVEEVREGEAVTAGLTQEAWKEQLDIDVPGIGPEEAAGRLLSKAEEGDLILHEYYLTDKAGHSRDHEKAGRVISLYDRFLDTLIKERKEEFTLVLCSDHGNVEDLSTKTHTRNRVPLFVEGPAAACFKEAESILDVTPAILKSLEKDS